MNSYLSNRNKFILQTIFIQYQLKQSFERDCFVGNSKLKTRSDEKKGVKHEVFSVFAIDDDRFIPICNTL